MGEVVLSWLIYWAIGGAIATTTCTCCYLDPQSRGDRTAWATAIVAGVLWAIVVPVSVAGMLWRSNIAKEGSNRIP